jgi:hypothetical protein
MEWIDELAEALGQEPLSEGERERLLTAARDVAHRVERKATPLAAFLLGAATERRAISGSDRSAATEAALATLARVLPPAPSEDPNPPRR